MNVLIDTNVLSELKRGRNASPRVMAWFSALVPENLFTSVIVLGEIRRGIELIARRDEAQAAVAGSAVTARAVWHGGSVKCMRHDFAHDARQGLAAKL